MRRDKPPELNEGMLRRVITHSKAKGSARFVLMSIALLTKRRTGVATFSLAELSAESHVTPRTVKKACRILEASGEMEIRRGVGPEGRDVYRIHLPAGEG